MCEWANDLGITPDNVRNAVADMRLDWVHATSTDHILFAETPDSVAEDAVRCEPVSASNSLLTGKLTGNLAISGAPSSYFCGSM